MAKRAREGGDHPFGSILVGPDGAILKEQGNGFTAEGGDMTAHAERLLVDLGVEDLRGRSPRRLHAL